MRIPITCLSFLLFICSVTFAQDWKSPSSSPTGVSDYRKKAEEKQKSRWTLQDWLAQKERNKMMDLWLGMYSPSPYELILGGSYNDSTLKIDNPFSETKKFSMSGRLAFYALILGIEGFYQNNWVEAFTESGGLVALRIAGKAVQNTHLILQYGIRNKVASNFNFQSQFAALDLDIYVQSHTGLHANYRHYLPTTDTTLGQITGRRWEAGLFFDISFIRIFGNWYSDLQTQTNAGSTVNQERSGINSGLLFFF